MPAPDARVLVIPPLANGRPIPSEVQLQQEFGVARGTARKAVPALREAGRVHTVIGKGTYVGPPPERRA